MYVAFADIDVGTRKKVLSRVGIKLTEKFGSVPDTPEKFEEVFNGSEIDSDVISILRNEYGSTGFTVSYTVGQLYDEYKRLMK